ncbi:MAG: ABC transporter ATP-binding protein [Chloroflexi bacterium]|nr:ABC transporter ATP-binding protein [Chloroflexota bacterium]
MSTVTARPGSAAVDPRAGTRPSQPVIQARDLVKRYGELVAVDGVSFEVEQGEIFGLLGPNGAGKTTTVEMLEGLRKPDGGSALVLGLDVARQADVLKERIGVQLQTAALYPLLTVEEVIDLFASFYRRSRPARELIEALDLGERRLAFTRDLSGGQRQRLSVALALVNDPELIFLDEPTTGMDPQARRSLWDLIASLRERGKSVLLTTHYMEEAEQLCDRIGIMDHGKVLEMGTVEDLISKRFRERSVRFDDIGELPEERLAALPGVVRVVREDGVVALYTPDVAATIGGLLQATEALGREPANLVIRRATLEDVFLDLTGRALRD